MKNVDARDILQAVCSYIGVDQKTALGHLVKMSKSFEKIHSEQPKESEKLKKYFVAREIISGTPKPGDIVLNHLGEEAVFIGYNNKLWGHRCEVEAIRDGYFDKKGERTDLREEDIKVLGMMCLYSSETNEKVGIIEDESDWVETGHQFEEEDVSLYISSNGRKAKHIVPGDPVLTTIPGSQFVREGILKAIVRKDENEINWGDTYVIKDGKEQVGYEDGPELKYKYLDVGEYTVPMRNVRYKEIFTTMARLRCPKCKRK